jgi:23S rRNA pseudouridine1911/1915/1917 synthase
MDLPIVYEDEHILVVNKPAGLVVHPASGNWTGTLLNGLLHHCPALAHVPRAGIVHRLDKDTSGLMVVAKTIPAQTELVRQLQARTVKRIYRAIADGVVPFDGTISTQIGRDPHNRLKMAVLKFGGKPAITHVRVLERFDSHSYVECKLETGRTHQIRVHMRKHAIRWLATPCTATRATRWTSTWPMPSRLLAARRCTPTSWRWYTRPPARSAAGKPHAGRLHAPAQHPARRRRRAHGTGRIQEADDEDWDDEDDDDDGDIEVIYVRD